MAKEVIKLYILLLLHNKDLAFASESGLLHHPKSVSNVHPINTAKKSNENIHCLAIASLSTGFN